MEWRISSFEGRVHHRSFLQQQADHLIVAVLAGDVQERLIGHVQRRSVDGEQLVDEVFAVDSVRDLTEQLFELISVVLTNSFDELHPLALLSFVSSCSCLSHSLCLCCLSLSSFLFFFLFSLFRFVMGALSFFS